MGLAFSPDGKRLATVSNDRLIRQWTWKGHRVRSAPGPSRIASKCGVQSRWQASGQWLGGLGAALGLERRPAILWAYMPAEDACGPYVAFSRDGQWLLSASRDGKAGRWPLPRMPADLREMQLRTWLPSVGAWMGTVALRFCL